MQANPQRFDEFIITSSEQLADIAAQLRTPRELPDERTARLPDGFLSTVQRIYEGAQTFGLTELCSIGHEFAATNWHSAVTKQELSRDAILRILRSIAVLRSLLDEALDRQATMNSTPRQGQRKFKAPQEIAKHLDSLPKLTTTRPLAEGYSTAPLKHSIASVFRHADA